MKPRIVAEVNVRYINPKGIELDTREMGEFLSRVRVSNPAYSDRGRAQELTIRTEAYEEQWVDDENDAGGYWKRMPPSFINADGDREYFTTDDDTSTNVASSDRS